jgi:hypothetical protein
MLIFTPELVTDLAVFFFPNIAFSAVLLSLHMVYCGQTQNETPAVLPPLWQLLEQRQPRLAAPRVLQGSGVNSAALKRTLNLAMINTGAYVSKRNREGSNTQNPKGLADLLLGFFKVFGQQMTRWSEGRQGSTKRCSTW